VAYCAAWASRWKRLLAALLNASSLPMRTSRGVHTAPLTPTRPCARQCNRALTVRGDATKTKTNWDRHASGLMRLLGGYRAVRGHTLDSSGRNKSSLSA